jgi:hypothetical protein
VKQLDVFEAMLGNPVGSLELRDRDGMTDDHRDKVVAAAERPLLVWELDSIESYLIGPTVIARVVNEIAVERALTVEVTEAEIEKTIDESCEELKTTALDRLGQRFTEDVWRHSGERIGVPRANEAARAMIDENWQTIEGKLRVVSGKQLLSVIRRMIQDAYGVNFGNERLAEAFVQEEVPAEIAEALRRVAELDAPQPTADATTVGPADA